MAGRPTLAQTALIVDDDLGFVWWLGDILTEAGCRALPALTCAEAIANTKRLSIRPNLIILNPDLGGASRMLQYYLKRNPHSKIVTIGPADDRLGPSTYIHGVLEPPSPSEPIVRAEWLQKARKLLNQLAAAAAE